MFKRAFKKQKLNQKGQALLIVVLAMAAILTVVLSVASRSVTDVSITSSEENALRAFSAAEAGIERSLLTGEGASGNPSTGVTFNTTINTPTQGNSFVYPSPLYPGESATFWFVGKDKDNNFTCAAGGCFSKNKISNLCWGTNPPYTNNADKPAVLLTVYYDPTGKAVTTQDFSGVKVARKGYDPNTSRTSSNNFDSASTTTCKIGNTTFSFGKANIQFVNPDLGIPNTCGAGCLLMAKVRIFYNKPTLPEQIGMDFVGATGNGLPAQGNIIESTGLAGESTRKVNVFQSFDEPPSIFDVSVFSLADFVKN